MTREKEPSDPRSNARLWGSDPIAGMLRALEIDFIALTPGASFRGLHDSLVNYLSNVDPKLLLCLHEEHAVSIAHGYAKVSGKPMAVAVHTNVGLMHASMAIFNAWCDRVPVLLIGAVGPLDAAQRRPFIDWIHTSRDLGALIRGYIKWDDQPSSVPAALESMLRAYQIAVTEPRGPTFVCLDATLQETEIQGGMSLPDVKRFRPATAAAPQASLVEQIARILTAAGRPVVLMGRVSSDREHWKQRVELCERLNAPVITDLKTGASFPTEHPLHPCPPGLFISAEAGKLIDGADVILSLDWIDLGGTMKQASGGRWPKAKVIQCSLDQYSHNGWSMDYQALPPADVSVLASPNQLVPMLLEAIPKRGSHSSRSVVRRSEAAAPPLSPEKGRISVEHMSRTIVAAMAQEKPTYIRLPIGWPGDCCHFADPLDYIGYDGGGGLASGPGMAVGAALALRGSDRLPVAILGDGDYLMGLTAIWTAVHHKTPVLIIVANNQSFFNDELHQERVAVHRDRPVENRSIGLRMGDPPLNMATLAEGQGAIGVGPVQSLEELRAAVSSAAQVVRAGAVCVVDVRVVPEYGRAVSSALLRQVPSNG